VGWWRGLARFSADVGPTAREDVACLVVLNVPGSEVQSFLGQYDLAWDPRPNRALLLDRHEPAAQVIVPFVRPDTAERWQQW
jgi:S-DNA-T family DNA segregation ATPase FtsK/SpoIIIE